MSAANLPIPHVLRTRRLLAIGKLLIVLTSWLSVHCSYIGSPAGTVITGSIENDSLVGGLVNPAASIRSITVYDSPHSAVVTHEDMVRCSRVQVTEDAPLEDFRHALATTAPMDGYRPASVKRGIIRVALTNGTTLFIYYTVDENQIARLCAPGYDGHAGTIKYNNEVGRWLYTHVYASPTHWMM